MDAEIIAVGSELLTPVRIDTNSLYLTVELNALGVEVVMKAIVGDDRDRLAAAVRAALKRSEILLISGGLGPTEDDVTRDAVALALERQQNYLPEIAEAIEQRFRLTNRTMSEINRRQAYVIEGAEVLPNANGTAPGQWIALNGRAIALLPGPPGELKPMFEHSVRSKLRKMVPAQVIRTRTYRVAGLAESDLDQRISPVYRQYANPVTTILAAPGDIQVQLRARCGTVEEADSLLEEVGSRIEEILGLAIFSRDGESLETVLGRRLRERSATLSVAESCTGGLLAERITSVAGSSEYFLGGLLVYSSSMKTELAGVDAALIERHGPVSEPVATALAAGVRQRTGSTYALSITGVAGPGGGTEEVPVGTVFIGLASAEGAGARHFRFLGDRSRVRAFATQTALDMLRRRLESVSGASPTRA